MIRRSKVLKEDYYGYLDRMEKTVEVYYWGTDAWKELDGGVRLEKKEYLIGVLIHGKSQMEELDLRRMNTWAIQFVRWKTTDANRHIVHERL